MRTITHKISGIVLVGALYALAERGYYAIDIAGHVSVGVLAGCTAPDWMEVPSWKDGKRESLIPHRQITHWMLGWAVFLWWAWNEASATQLFWWWWVTGFAAGGLLHVVMDSFTPMKVPMILFWQRRRVRI